MATGSPEDLKKALRSVRIDPVLAKTMPMMATKVEMLARANLSGVPGRFSRKHAKVGKGRGKGGRFAGGVELRGLLAVVAEYGMNGRHWFYWGRHKNASPVPPPRATMNRPKPTDGHVIGKAYKMLQEDLYEFAVDQMWEQYEIQFDAKKIYKVKG